MLNLTKLCKLASTRIHHQVPFTEISTYFGPVSFPFVPFFYGSRYTSPGNELGFGSSGTHSERHGRPATGAEPWVEII